jgi:hypothetical protein
MFGIGISFGMDSDWISDLRLSLSTIIAIFPAAALSAIIGHGHCCPCARAAILPTRRAPPHAI